MRIAYLLNKFPLLSETFILNQITGLIDRGHAVDIFVRGPEPQPKQHPDVERYGLQAIDLHQDSIDAAEYSTLRRRTLRSLLWRARLKDCVRLLRAPDRYWTLAGLYPIGEFLHRGRYDIVHAHYGMNGDWAVRLRHAGAFDAKLVTTFHDGFDLAGHLHRHGREAYARVFEHGELLLAASDHVAGLLAELGAPRSKLLTHRVGVDLWRFAVQRESRSTLDLRVLSVARLVEMKGIEYALQALLPLLREFPGIRYTVAGDGPLRGELEQLVNTLGLAGHVKLMGWCDQAEVMRLFEESDVLLAPSVTAADGAREGIPTVLMEAMASGLPVIGTRYSGIPELIRHGVDGYLTEERDVEAIAAALGELARDPDRRRTMGDAGRARAAAMHDIEVLNGRLEAHFRRLTGGVR